jgi:hypothetical protein
MVFRRLFRARRNKLGSPASRIAAMRFCVAIACSLVFTAALLLCACQRHYSAGAQPQQYGAATHPWEMKDFRMPLAPREGQAGGAAEVDIPPDIGPQLPKTDTIDPAQLPGLWLQVCGAANERVNLVLPENMNELELREGGTAQFREIQDNKAKIYDGTWEKTKPGRLRLAFPGATDAEYFAVLFRGEFLYIWDQKRGEADWYARVPLLPTPRIMANHFDTQAGELKLTKVVGSSYEGQILSRDGLVVRVAGFYQSGILTMRWEDAQRKSEGYAAFHVDQQWNSLYGALWLDDFNGSPFVGPWDGVRAQEQPAQQTP